MAIADYATDAIPELNTAGEHMDVSMDDNGSTGNDNVNGQQTVFEDDNGNVNPKGQQPVQPTWNGQEYALNFRGKQIVPRDKEHLLRLAQQGYSYETRAQELARREQEIQSRSERYSQLEQLQQAFETNPILQQQLIEMYRNSLAGQQQPVDSNGGQHADNGIYHTLLDKYQTLEQKLGSYEQQQADAALDSEIKSLQGKYQRQDWDMSDENGQSLTQAVIKRAYDLGGVPLETAYRDLMWDSQQQNVQAEALKKQQQTRQAQTRAGVVSTGTGAQRPAQQQNIDLRSMNYNDIARLAMSQR